MRLRALWAKSDAAIANGMPILTVDQINEEVSELRGNDVKQALASKFFRDRYYSRIMELKRSVATVSEGLAEKMRAGD
jgi:hypothetical protein